MQSSQATLSNTVEQHNTPKIRNMSVYQVNDLRSTQGWEPRGEYDLDSAPNLDPHKILNETKTDLINRLLKHIETLFKKAARQHIQDNFTSALSRMRTHVKTFLKVSGMHSTEYQIEKMVHAICAFKNWSIGEMDDDKQNNITRLSLHEFSLYPHPSNGPFTVSDFNQILTRIYAIAEKYPENLQLVLGTLPLRVGNQRVKNVALFVQCGKNPSINAFSKKFDYLHCSLEMPSKKPKKMVEDTCYLYQVVDPVTHQKQWELSYLDDVISITIPESEFKTTAGLEAVPDLLGKKRSNTFDDNADHLTKLITRYYYEKYKQFLYADPQYDNGSQQITAALVDDEALLIPIEEGGNFTYTTANGIKVRLVINICGDHFNNVGLTLAENEIKTEIAKGKTTLPEFGENLILSNVLDTRTARLISDSVFIVDPMHSNFQYASVVSLLDAYNKRETIEANENIDSSFGPSTQMNIHEIEDISLHKFHFKKIKQHNMAISRSIPFESDSESSSESEEVEEVQQSKKKKIKLNPIQLVTTSSTPLFSSNSPALPPLFFSSSSSSPVSSDTDTQTSDIEMGSDTSTSLTPVSPG